MQVSKNQIIQRDVESIVNSQSVEWKRFKGKSLLITGATGMIGSLLLRTVALADKNYNLDMKIYIMIRNKEKAEKILAEIENSENVINVILVEQDMTKKIDLAYNVNFIIHCANITDSWSFVHKPVETIESTLSGCINILEFAKNSHAESVVFPSSMEIYGQTDTRYIRECDYGYLDPTEVRSSYPEAKRMCECICTSYFKEYDVPVKIARLTQTFGPGVDYNDNRVFMEFSRAVLENKDIVLHTSGKTERCYCYTADAVQALLILLLNGENGEAYNIANENTEISIYDMAQMLAEKYLGDKSRVQIELEDDQIHGYNPEGRTCINCDKIKKIGWTPAVGIEQMFDALISSMRNQKNKSMN